ncbi:hypothetical protein [Stenotrophomonas maltophilia]|uniref:hypothetical protein n=1 Tax=Stenotrophomonas maltophilia TaxID=40324 RepID=UPI000C1535B1|nr:hypothetical protein [Stenotrophomonas maltophilia]HEL3171251.1 hypothetical protein [Stenotrophomonas maltophilia]
MKIQIRCLDEHGNYVRTLTAEALPLHPRLVAPVNCQLNLTDDDFKRLMRAFLRFTRSIEARQAIGDIGLAFSNGQLLASKMPRHSDVKVLAMEMRPFFLEKDPLCFTKLLSLRSLGAKEDLRPCLRQHRLRWEHSAFEGRMSMTVDGTTLNTSAVVRAWFNDDFFHSESNRASELSLVQLVSNAGGENQAMSLLTHHMIESLRVISEFFQDIYAVSSEFRAWSTTVPGWTKRN